MVESGFISRFVSSGLFLFDQSLDKILLLNTGNRAKEKLYP